jgi:hypothetical protein
MRYAVASQTLILLLAGALAMSSIFATSFAMQAGARRMDGSARSVGCTVLVDNAASTVAGYGGLRQFERVQEAVDAAGPGDIICVASLDHSDERIAVMRSGRAGAPIRIVALGSVRIAGFIVDADHVEIEGFFVSNVGHDDDRGRSMGIYLAGSFLRVENNTVSATDGDGIGCDAYPASCADVVISHNTIRDADGAGILVAGKRILVEYNDVAGSVKNRASDADGIRFFGSRITIRGNYVHDISDRGYPKGDNPHTDCFQTFDNGKPSTYDVIIEGNVCDNVDHQCLIASASDRRTSGLIIFRNNICRNNGSQGVYLLDFPSAQITNNLFLPSIAYFGVVLRSGSANTVIVNNVFIGSIGPYHADESSRSGLRADYNLIYDPSGRTRPEWYSWSEPSGLWGESPMLLDLRLAPPQVALRSGKRSPLVDAGSMAFDHASSDITGKARVIDGNGDGSVDIDIGPFEFEMPLEVNTMNSMRPTIANGRH